MKLILVISVLALLYFLESIFPLFKGRKDRFKHLLPNASIAIINAFIGVFIFAFLLIQITSWSGEHSFGLLRIVPLPVWAVWIIGFVLFDLWMYFWHRMNHEIPFLWRFHRMHHSDLQMDASTALRFHPIEIVFSSFARLIIVALLGLNWEQLLLYEICLQPVILFHHSNVGLPEKQDRVLRSIFVSPNMHRVHHSQIVVETNSNYSSIFSMWDRLFHSYKKHEPIEGVVFGLPNFQESKWQKVLGMIKTPFAPLR